MLEAGVRQFAVWAGTDEGRRILIAVARYLAAHSPTERAALQTADIARRLMRAANCIKAPRRHDACQQGRQTLARAKSARQRFRVSALLALLDRENFDLVVASQDIVTRGSADQSPRDGGDVRN